MIWDWGMARGGIYGVDRCVDEGVSERDDERDGEGIPAMQAQTGKGDGGDWRVEWLGRRCLRTLRAHSDLAGVAARDPRRVTGVTVTVTGGSLLIDAGSGSDSSAFPASTSTLAPTLALDDYFRLCVVGHVCLPP